MYSEKAMNNSWALLSHVVDQLKGIGLPVRIKSCEDIDEDFCFATASQFYFKGVSRMSDLVCECLDRSVTPLSLEGPARSLRKRMRAIRRTLQQRR